MSIEDGAVDGVGTFPSALGEELATSLIRQLADRLPGVALVASAPDLRIVYANAAAHRVAGIAPGPLTGRIATEVFAFVDPMLLTGAIGAEAHAVAAPDGAATRWWDVACVPLDVAAGEAPIVLITATDVTHHVTARRESQAAMRESEERLRAVLLQVPAAIFILDAADGRVTFRSRMLDAVLGDLGLDPDTGQPTLASGAVHPDGSPYALSEYPSRRALQRGETVRAEPLVFRRTDGVILDLEMYAGPVRGDAGEIIAAVAVAIDVTQRRQIEARAAFLFRLQDALRALSDPTEILVAAETILGEYLGAARVGHGEMQPDDATMLIATGYVDGAPPVNGPLPLALLGPDHEARLRQGLTVVYADALADSLGAHVLGLEFGTRAHVSVPLLRDGRLTGALYVTHSKPYAWGPAEIALIEDVAARIWDAAERGRAEARLRESEARLRLVMESTGLGVWEFDTVTGAIIRSARHDAIFGYAEPAGDWSWDRFRDHVDEGDRPAWEAGFRAALEQVEAWNLECRIVRADGAPGWIQVRAQPHRGADGKVARLLGTIADITERKRAEAAVAEHAGRFEKLAQSLPSMVWSSLPDGQIEWFNARVPEYCGIAGDQMKPDGWAPVHPEDMDTATRLYREALASGTPYVAEYRIRRHDGLYRWHITRAIPIREADGTISRWIGSSADIEDRKRSEQALADLNATLEQQVRDRTAALLAAEDTLRQSQKMEAVGQLTGGLAHDFNNLLTGITGSLELLSTRLEQGRYAELGRYLEIAHGGAMRAAALTHRLLAFSRRQTLDPRPTDINQLVRGMDELVRRTVGPAVAVTVTAAPGLWAVLADPNQLENALLNLCLNARDAMPDGGGLIIETANRVLDEAEARALELQAGEYVALSVSDTGGGMTAEVIARAFDPFYTTKPLGEGTGLGLSMVYGFVRQSGGQARIRSQPGQGTEVRLYLPRHRTDGEALRSETRPAPRGDQRGDGQTILVVDDEPSVRLLVREVLEGLGYAVLQADTGAAALRILQSGRRVDLLITDVGMPGGMNGRQLADAALPGRPGLKVLFITGYAESAVIGEGYLKPPLYILTKPFSLETLATCVKQIVEAS